jgi:hypothetical protein
MTARVLSQLGTVLVPVDQRPVDQAPVDRP